MKVMRMHATQQNPALEEFRLQNKAAKYGLAPSALSICLWVPDKEFVCVPFTDDDQEDDSAEVIVE